MKKILGYTKSSKKIVSFKDWKKSPKAKEILKKLAGK